MSDLTKIQTSRLNTEEVMLNSGDQDIAGNKNFTGALTLNGKNVITSVGGTMSSHITYTTTNAIRQSVDNSSISIWGGSTAYNAGAFLKLDGKNETSEPGWFVLCASNGTNTPALTGKPDGTLTWNGKSLLKSGDIDTSSFANTSASNFNATGKSTIVGWGIPDYSAGIVMPANTDFTCPTIGVVSGELSAANHGYCNVIINGVLVQQVGSENEQRCRGPFYAQVKQGDVVHLQSVGNASITLCKFYPLKGAN